MATPMRGGHRSATWTAKATRINTPHNSAEMMRKRVLTANTLVRWHRGSRPGVYTEEQRCPPQVRS